MWWGSAPTPRPLTRAKSAREKRAWGAERPLSPRHLGPRGRGAPHPNPSLLENRRGPGLAGARAPAFLELCSVVRQGDGASTACGCPPAPRQGRGAVVNHPLARPKGTGCPRPRRGVWARVVVHGGRERYTPPPLRDRPGPVKCVTASRCHTFEIIRGDYSKMIASSFFK